MTYEEFTDFIMAHLWREGDDDVLLKIPTFVTLAEAKLNRDMLIEERSDLVIAVADANRVALPDDYMVLRNVDAPAYDFRGGMSYITPSAMSRLRYNTGQHNFTAHYSIQNNNLLLSGPFSVTNTLTLEIQYYTRLPSLVTDGTSWVLDQYFDLYLYAVLENTAGYFREDPRLSIWKVEYMERLASVLDFNQQKKYGQGPLHMPLPGIVA